MSKFYTFRQNNSGGRWQTDPDKGVSVEVTIEADDHVRANIIARRYVGIYFDGCDDGIDCDCCGDRWYRVRDYDGQDTPPAPRANIPQWYPSPYGYIHHLNGTTESY